jgi:serine/threonine-protein kinase
MIEGHDDADLPGPDAEPETALDQPNVSDVKTVVLPSASRHDDAVKPRESSIMSAASDLPSRSLASQATSGSTSPIDALKRTEILTTRSFTRVAMVMAAGGVVATPLLPGHPVATYILLGATAVSAVGLFYLYRRTLDPTTYYDGNGVAIAWYLAGIAPIGSIPFCGPFSVIVSLPLLAVYLVGSGASFRLALALYLTTALVEGVCGALVIAGFEDPGFIHLVDLPTHILVIGLFFVEFMLLGTFLAARGARRSSLVALGELEQAVRAVAHREALLEEAREELRRAVGTGRGRFTDQQIGRYRLGDVIGRGAMGEVYEASDPAGQSVAIKMLSQASLRNIEHVQRFLRELRTTATIDSPNVVHVLDVGEQPLPHLVMERLRGRDLATILRDKAKLSSVKIVEMLHQVGAGVTAAGRAGIVHRDLKPQNVFLSGATWKVLDFGVARLADTGDTLTSGQVVGTPTYMAPEQARGDAVDHRTDLYALAAIAYRALTGHAPFSTSGAMVADLLYRVVHVAPQRPTALAELPADVDLALAIGLAKDPAARFATASELVLAIADALAGTLPPVLRERAAHIADAWAKPKALYA